MVTIVDKQRAIAGTPNKSALLISAAKWGLYQQITTQEIRKTKRRLSKDELPACNNPIPQQALEYLLLIMNNRAVAHHRDPLLYQWLQAVIDNGYDVQPEAYALLASLVGKIDKRVRYIQLCLQALIVERIIDLRQMVKRYDATLIPEPLLHKGRNKDCLQQLQELHEQHDEKEARWLDDYHALQDGESKRPIYGLMRRLGQLQLTWSLHLSETILDYSYENKYSMSQYMEGLPWFASRLSLDIYDTTLYSLYHLPTAVDSTILLKNIPSHRKHVDEAIYIMTFRRKMMEAINGHTS